MGLSRWGSMSRASRTGALSRALSRAFSQGKDGWSVMADDWVDFALAAYREEGVWQVQELAHAHVVDIEDLARSLRRFPGDGGTLGMISIDETYALLVR